MKRKWEIISVILKPGYINLKHYFMLHVLNFIVKTVLWSLLVF